MSPSVSTPAVRVRKRSGQFVDYSSQKIVQAVRLCLVNGCCKEDDNATRNLADRVADRIQQLIPSSPGSIVTIEQIQNLVETVLMSFGEHAAAKHFILYRDERRRLREEQEAKKASIFKRRDAFKPFEYHDMAEYKTAIQHAYWLVSEFNFIADIHEFHVLLSDAERSAIARALLAISQIEVSVKRFWAQIGQRFPKAEIEQVGMVFAESEVRHADAYSHLLQLLGLEEEFDGILKVPAIRARVDYLQNALQGASKVEDEEYALTLSLFSLFIENVSLFSQFAVVKSFNRHRRVLKDVDNVVQATQKEEQIHALFGACLVNHIRREKPQWFNAEFYSRLHNAARQALDAETRIIDWIFAEGEMPFLSRAALVEFIKHRLNESLAMIGSKKLFTIDPVLLQDLAWFTDEIAADVHTDFFHKRPVTYTKHSQAYSADALF
jgi:ribonucleoside-diphosphate reductase beta chain